jgi:hypothetical protein
MSFVRNLYADLIEKRLWPVAVVLLVALVAIPILVAKPATESGSTAPTTVDTALLGADSAAVIGETKPVVSLGSDGGFRKHIARLGRKDPFIQQAKDKASNTSENATVQAGGTTGPTGTTLGPTGTTPTETPGSTTTPTTPSGGKQPVKVYEWAASVKFGKIDQTKSETVKPAEFMPSENNPVLLFLGADKSGKKALFLVSSEATSRGDGTCTPSESSCKIVKLAKGDVQFFEVALSADTVITYELELTDIKLQEVKKAKTSQRNAEFIQKLASRKPRQIRESMRTKRVLKALGDLGF